MSQIAINLLSNALKFTPTGGQVIARLQRRAIAQSSAWKTPVRALNPSFCRACSRHSCRDLREPLDRLAWVSVVESCGRWSSCTGHCSGGKRRPGSRRALHCRVAHHCAAATAEAAASLALTGPRVLVVEDNDDARETVATVWACAVYSVATCATGEAALDWLGREAAERHPGRHRSARYQTAINSCVSAPASGLCLETPCACGDRSGRAG